MAKHLFVEVVSGREGPCLVLADKDGSGYRIAGSTPWGGGSTTHRFKVNLDELIREATSIAERLPA